MQHLRWVHYLPEASPPKPENKEGDKLDKDEDMTNFSPYDI